MKDDFRKLKRNIFFHALLITAIGLAVGLLIKVLLIDGILQAPFADAFVGFCMRVLNMDWYGAAALYNTLFRSQKTLLLTIGLLLLLIVIFYYSLSRVTRYFKDASVGVSKLLDGGDADIRLAPELDFMETRLNSIKNTLEKREQDAKEAEARKNDLVMYLAHDIRTPLTSVIGYLNLLQESPELSAAQRAKYLGITLENAYRLETLINEFFDITRFNLQTIVLDARALDLSLMLMQLADEFFPLLQPQGKTITVNAGDRLTIQGDAEKLARVFRNVIKNALTYSADATEIKISAVSEGNTVKTTVFNRGKPIPEAELNAVFEKFRRLDAARSSKTGGAGLGLAIAREIVLAHQGTIYAESNENGTVFSIILPADISNS